MQMVPSNVPDIDVHIGLPQLINKAQEAVEFIVQESRCDAVIMRTLKRTSSFSNGKKPKGTDVTNNEMKYLLDQCLDHLSKLNECTKAIRKKSHGHLDIQYVHAYFYYKIVHILMTNVIPGLSEFQSLKNTIKKKAGSIESELLQIYNVILSSLISDETIEIIHHSKAILKVNESNYNEKQVSEKHTPSNKSSLTENDQPQLCAHINSSQLDKLLRQNSNDLLIIDVRERESYNNVHIRAQNILCLEPIAFSENYTYRDLVKRSMITAPKDEILLLGNLSNFKYIILTTALSSDLSKSYSSKLDCLKEILYQYLTMQPNGRFSRLLVHKDGIEAWCKDGYIVEHSDDHEKSIGDDSEESLMDSTRESSGESNEVITTKDDSVYVSGDLRSLSLQELPELTPSVSNSMDSSMMAMMRPEAVTQGYNNIYQNPTERKVSRSSSFKNFFNKKRTSSMSLGSHTRSVSTPMAPINDLYNDTKLNPNSFNDRSLSGLSLDPPLKPMPISYPSNPVIKTTKTQAMSPGPAKSVSPSSLTFVGDDVSKSPTSLRSSSNATIKEVLSSPTGRKFNHSVLPNTKKDYDLNFTVGLENMGNSCYMNCILQCIMGTNELSQIFLNNSYEKHININSKLGSKGVLARYFARLAHIMHQTSYDQEKKAAIVRPTQFRMAIASINSMFRNTNQQDCQEFCQFLLDGLHEDLNQCGNNPPLKELSEEAEKKRELLSLRIASSIEWERFLTTNFSVIIDLFQGQYASRLKCSVCSNTSTTYQPFSVLSVPLPTGTKSSVNLMDCFNEFTKCEKLEHDEYWNCPTCKKKQPSTKQLTITRLPRNLIIHLKRFDNRMNKNTKLIDYPFNLDLTSFWANDKDDRLPPGVSIDELPARGQIPPFKYSLYAVANHFGSLYGGHYTSYVNKGLSRGWYYFDDQNYRLVKKTSEVVNSNAYVLFYRRVHGI